MQTVYKYNELKAKKWFNVIGFYYDLPLKNGDIITDTIISWLTVAVQAATGWQDFNNTKKLIIEHTTDKK